MKKKCGEVGTVVSAPTRAEWHPPFSVMAGLVPAIHVGQRAAVVAWMAGTSPAMTAEGAIRHGESVH